MSGVNIEYKGESIATIPATGSKTIKTQGKYCEGDILVEYEAPPTPSPTLQAKSVTPTTSQQSVTPDSGYDGLSNVTVNATPLEAKTVTPTSQQQVVTPTAPNIGLSSVTVGAAPQPTLITKQITENGTYTAADDNADGYSEVTVDVPDGIESLLANTLTSVTLPTLTSIPKNAFTNKSALVSVSAPNVTRVESFAFSTCLNLETISFSNQMTSIGEESFCNCPKLLLSELPDTITTIGARAFQATEKIAITKLPSSITSIGNYAFYDCRAIPFLDMTNMPMVPPTLGSNVFLTRRELIFYFDTQAKLDAYSVATNWSTYADSFQIKPSEV